MTTHKHLKRRVRERMARTGEPYTVARRHVLALGDAAPPDHPWHLPGVHPESAALRALLKHAGVRAPDGQPLSEALTLVLLGGVGAGAIGFRYEQADFSSFFVACRHLWQDNRRALTEALARLGLTPTLRESGAPGRARADLDAALAEGPAIAWVDLAPLGYRGFPEQLSGAGYHVLVVHAIDGERAWLGDLADDPIPLPLEALAAARGRIRKDKHRLLTLPRAEARPDLSGAIRAALAAGHAGLAPSTPRTFNLAALDAWAKDVASPRGRDAWATRFPRGRPLWQVLCATWQYIERHHVGGGALRPLYARGLAEAAALLDDPRLMDLSARYEALGASWTALADAALPSEVPAMAEARALLGAAEQAFLDQGAAGEAEARAARARLDALACEAARDFPLDEAETAALRSALAAKIEAVAAEERRAWSALGDWLAV